MKPPTRAPFFACLYHGLCEIARKHGYALAIHGTVATDLDLIAVPWIDDAAPAEALKDALMEHIGACGFEDLLRRDTVMTEDQIRQRLEQMGHAECTPKPHGRRAWNLYMDAGAKVDLSIMPRVMPTAPGDDAIVS